MTLQHDDQRSALVVDDEPGHRMLVRAVLEDAGWRVTDAPSGEAALAVLDRAQPHVALVDMKMPGMDGLTLLRELHARMPELPVVLLTAFGSVGSAVDAMKQGAFNYLTKPADNDELVAVLEKSYEYRQLLDENARLRKPEGEGIVGGSPGMARVRELIEQAGPSEATVLILGESGTGKELVADALHAASPRARKPLIKVNCAALPADLLESELFGYVKGAFTGAVKDKPGRFQLASGGTLFLDEIGDMPLGLQSRLLRVLQERQVTPLGEGRPVPVDFALICATHRQLREESEAGRFRADLYYRLNGLTLNLPPLRQRSDLDRVVARMLAELAPGQGLELHPEVAAAFAAYHWPGNLRQLANGLRTAVALLDGGEAWIGWEHLPDDLVEELRQEREEAVAAPVATLATSLADLSRAAIDRVLAQERGNVSAAARRLGISRNTLYRKLRRD